MGKSTSPLWPFCRVVNLTPPSVEYLTARLMATPWLLEAHTFCSASMMSLPFLYRVTQPGMWVSKRVFSNGYTCGSPTLLQVLTGFTGILVSIRSHFHFKPHADSVRVERSLHPKHQTLDF